MTDYQKTEEGIPPKMSDVSLGMSEERYRLLTENMTDVIWQTTPDLIITYVTPSVNKVLGYEPQELIGVHLTNLLIPTARELFRNRCPEIVRQLAEHREIGRDAYAVEQIRKDGTTVWTEVVTAPFLDGAGKFSGFQGVTRDISKRKEDEEMLRASEEEFFKAFMLTPDAIAISRLSDGVIIMINEGFTEILGYEAEEIVGGTAAELNIWNNPEDRNAIIDELKNKGVVNNFETSCRTKNGQIRYGLASATIVELYGTKHSVIVVKDLTDRKLSQDALRRSTEKFGKVFFQIPDAIVITRLADGIIVSVNEGLKRFLGYRQDDVTGKTALQVNMWADLEDRNRLVKELKAEGEVTNFETSFRTKDGDIRRGLLSSSIITLDGEKHILNVVRNITELQHAEEDLRASERKYRLLFDNAPIGILLVDTEGKILEANRHIISIFGSPAPEATKLINMLTFPPVVETGISDLFRTCLNKSRQIDTEVFYTSKWGKEIWLRIILSPKLDEQGHVEGCLAVMEDVMPRKLAEKAQKESEEKYRALIETTDTGYLILNSEGKVTDANSEYLKLSGHTTLDEIIGRSVVEWTAEHHREKNAAEVERCMQQGHVRGLEIDYVDQKGQITPVEINGTVLKIGQFSQILALCRDITWRKRIEEELRTAQHQLEARVNERTSKLLEANERLQMEIGERLRENESCGRIITSWSLLLRWPPSFAPRLKRQTAPKVSFWRI